MVLESVSDSQAYDASPIEDTGTSSSEPTEITAYNEASIQHPAPLIGPLFGYTTTQLVSFVNAQIKFQSKIADRSLTQDEATAIAYWSARTYSTVSYGPPSGLLAGCYRAYMTQATYRFPFYTPKPGAFDFSKLGTLTGTRAQIGWHMLRYSAYGVLGSWVGKIIIFSYALSIRMLGQRSDPRLKSLMEADMAYAKDVAERRRKPIGQDNSQNRQQIPRTSQEPQENSQRSQYESEQPGSSRISGSAQAAYGSFASQADRSKNDYDDASPTGGSFDLEYSSVEESTDSGAESGSAWDRIRRNAGSNPSSGAANASQKSGRGWARGSNQQSEEQSFQSSSFSASEEDKQLAKDEAQKDFDARVERERRGDDFGNVNAGRKW